jgi:hypothetical protein
MKRMRHLLYFFFAARADDLRREGFRVGGELFENCHFIRAVGEVERATGPNRHARLAGQFEPPLPAANRPPVRFPGRLADRPDHAEVSHRRSPGFHVALQEHDRPSAPGSVPRMRQPQNAGPDDRYVHMLDHVAPRECAYGLIGLAPVICNFFSLSARISAVAAVGARRGARW